MLNKAPEGWVGIETAVQLRILEDQRIGRVFEPVSNLEFYDNRGQLGISYCGGDTIIDAYMALAKTMSKLTCAGCGSVATREIFGYAKCEECE